MYHFYKILIIYFLCYIFSTEVAFSHTRDPKFEQISIDQGLSHPAVFSILQDSSGFLWFGTQDGLNRYDGYQFKIFKHDPYDTTSLSNNWITTMCETDTNTIWVGTNGGGVNRFDRRTEKFSRYLHHPNNPSVIPDNHINALLKDSDNMLWIGTRDGLARVNHTTFTVEQVFSDSSHFSLVKNQNILSIFEDCNKNIWIGTHGVGLIKFDHYTGIFKSCPINIDNNNSKTIKTINIIYEDEQLRLWLGTDGMGLVCLNEMAGMYSIYQNKNTSVSGIGINQIFSIMEDNKGICWIGTGGGGINHFDRENGKFYPHKCELNTVCCLGSNTIHAVFRDQKGVIWLGTDCCGLNKFVQEKTTVSHYANALQDLDAFSQYKVWSFFEDVSGVLWIATSHGLKEFIPGKNKVINHLHNPLETSSLSSNAVTVIFEDSEANLWVGTEDGLNLFDRHSSSFSHYHSDPNESFSISDNGIVCIAEDHLGNLWIGTRLGGLNKYDRQNNKFYRYIHDPINPASISNSAVMTILESRIHKSLWIGTFNGGLLKFNQDSGEFKHFIHSKTDINSISHNSVYSIYEDDHGILWIGTYGGGLNKFDPLTNKFTFFKEDDGLISNEINEVIGDNQGNLWLSTAKGLCIFDPAYKKFHNYHLNSGPNANLSNYGAFYKNRNGEFYYGAINGIYKYNPDSLVFNSYIPPVVLTGLLINNKPVELPHPINTLREIDLAYDQNFFSFEFAVLDYENPDANQFAHRLDGLEENWIYSGTDRFVKYTNINSGNYTLHVKGCNKDGVWNEKGISIKIHVAAPPWKTWWAYTIYVLIISSSVYILWHASIRRERLNNQLRFERFQSERLHEMNQLKSQFFANVSHEFRSPLTLILGPIKDLRNKIKDKVIDADLSMIQKNAIKVMNLINQLLDLSKLESGKMPLRVVNQNIVTFIKEIILTFAPHAERKNILLSFIPDRNEINVYFDPDLMDKIIGNLLSNAIKFTSSGGIVTVSLITQTDNNNSYVQKSKHQRGQGSWDRWVQISISDTGSGIPKKQLEKIFDYFYQFNEVEDENRKGSGIGLALTKELVELHKGKIVVTSNLAEGTTFTITLPLGKDHFSEQEIDLGEVLTDASKSIEDFSYDQAHEGVKLDNPGKNMDVNLPLILIVEDNTDVRSYIRKSIKEYFQIIEANNGNEGLQKALEHIPDLIISDVMMPGLNGTKLCKKIKSQEITSHIPVILLTVRSSDEDKLEGLESGADDYITKPFDTKELLARIKNLINQRSRIRDHFISNWNFELKNIITSQLDERFLQRAISIIEKHISDTEFNVELFCKELGVSRSQLHRKLTALTNQSSSKFIRTLRIKHAASLLASNAGNVFEVSQMVGFSNLSYFAKCFYEQFGISPSKYISKVKKS